MSELAVPKRQKDPDPAAEAYLSRVETELNTQHQDLRDQARALLAAVKGRRGISRDEDWQRIFQQATSTTRAAFFSSNNSGPSAISNPSSWPRWRNCVGLARGHPEPYRSRHYDGGQRRPRLPQHASRAGLDWEPLPRSRGRALQSPLPRKSPPRLDSRTFSVH
jgi:hypothetical protein